MLGVCPPLSLFLFVFGADEVVQACAFVLVVDLYAAAATCWTFEWDKGGGSVFEESGVGGCG